MLRAPYWRPSQSSGSVSPDASRETLMPMVKNVQDKLAIRELIENWAVWRDSFMWDKFRTVWHKEGRMWATWFQGTYEEFIAANLDGYRRGVRIYHFLGGSSIDIKGKRA